MHQQSMHGSNRTFMDLKSHSAEYLNPTNAVLIAPLWN